MTLAPHPLDEQITRESPPPSVGRFRWTICGLLFAATTINYMDRSILGVLGPTLQYKVMNWSDKDYASINISFKAAYAIGMLSMGAVIDRFGTKIGYTLAIGIWSIFGMLHAAVRPSYGFIGFCLARFGLGLGESGNFPAAIKAVSEWFPRKERALATGIFNAGSNVGAVLAPLVIPIIVLPDGTHWQYAFLTTGAFSALWVVAWLLLYRQPAAHPTLSAAEYAFIQSDSPPTAARKVRWAKVLPLRETWAFAVAKITDAVWWFYLFWGGKFLYDQFGLDIKGLALPLITIYVIADFGSIAGGWLSSSLIKRGWTVNKARKITMLLCALCILPVMFATQLGTRFGVDPTFYTKLAAATYPIEEVQVIDGHPTRHRVNHSVSADVVSQLHALDGQTFASAKDFLKAATSALGVDGKAVVKEVGPALLNSARSDNLYWIAVFLIAIAAGGHQAWSANIFTLVSDVFPRGAIASVIGIGGMVGAVSGMIADFSLGQVLSDKGSGGYFFAFFGAGICYLITLGIVHLLMPKMTPLDEELRHVVTP